MAFEDPSKDVQDDWLEILDIIFLVLYTIEMFLKVLHVIINKCIFRYLDLGLCVIMELIYEMHGIFSISL